MSREAVNFDSTVSALLALASASERSAYQRELANPYVRDGYEQVRVTTLQDLLLPRLIEKLQSGEWVATGFGYESGQPTELHPRLWQRLSINADTNSAYDSFAAMGGKSATGSFHTLGFRAAEKTDGLDTRAKTIAKIEVLFESLDTTLPLSASKKRFFHEASQAFDGPVPEAWLRLAWRNAKLQPARRRAGLKSG